VANIKQTIPLFIGSLCLGLLILDPSTAMHGASAGIDQCIRVILPSLFPCFFVTAYLNSRLLGVKLPVFNRLFKWLHVPVGGDSIVLLGIIGGYPVGAQTIASAYQRGALDRDCARILLGYCSNAGPAFIFGVTSCLFSSVSIPWVIWLTQLLAIFIAGFILPKPEGSEISFNGQTNISAVDAFQLSLRNIASVCGWVILFKVLISYLSKIITGNFPLILLSGILELSNGCLSLLSIPSESIRFILCNIMLSFGGLCVFMQTNSVVGKLGLGFYLPGKILQASISCIVSILLSNLFFHENSRTSAGVIICIILCILIILGTANYCRKKLWNFAAI